MVDRLAISMDTREALEIARDALTARAAETDTASPEGHTTREALAVIEMMLEQKGCEHFDPAVKDGLLTTLADVIIFG